MSGETTVKIKDGIANPAPLGLLGFAMTTILLNIHNAGFLPLSVMIMAMGIFIGGIAQVIAGVMEFKKGNTFGATAFTLYGFFWLSLVGIWTMPAMGLPKATPDAVGFYLAVWGVFSFFMFIGTLKMANISKIVFGSLTLLFALLAAGDFTGNGSITILAGYVGIFCGCSAFYDAVGQILNEVYGKKIFPL